MMRPVLLTSLIFIQLLCTATAQNLFGTWEGGQEVAFSWIHPDKIVLELNQETETTFTGISHTYYGRNYYEHYKVEGTIDRKKHRIVIREVATISVRISEMAQNYPGTYFMTYECSDNLCEMTGYWKPGQIVLFAAQRVGAYFHKTIVPPPAVKDTVAIVARPPVKPAPKDTTPVVVAPLPNPVTLRKEDLQSLIEIDPNANDSVHLAIYDNGEIDNDTISLYFNDRLLVSKQMISLKPITLAIAQRDITAFSKLKLFAENLGTIPPCTATMIITIGNKRYEVSLSSDLRKNATVEFFLKE